MSGKVETVLRTSYPSLAEATRAIATFFNAHEHPPYSTSRGAITVDTTLDGATHTVSVTASGLTITMPETSSIRIGQEWTVNLAVSGYVDIVVQGSDAFLLPEADSTIRLDVKGSSVTFRCVAAGFWGIV